MQFFSFNLELICFLWVFQKAEIALAGAARAISAFWKPHSYKLIPNWTRNPMMTYTNLFPPIQNVCIQHFADITVYIIR